MNQSSQPGTPEDGRPPTTTLHLNKFVPQPRQQPPPAPAAEDTATVVIRKLAAQVVASQPEPVAVPQGGGNALPATEMLGVVTYAYTKGVYRSEDIESKMVRDPALRQALGDGVPDAPTIRRFRRLNREAIVRTLESFSRWLRRKPALAAEAGQARPSAPGPPGVREGETTVVRMHQAAEDRLEKAMFTDNMARDQE